MKKQETHRALNIAGPGVRALNPGVFGAPATNVVSQIRDTEKKAKQPRQPNATERRMLDWCEADKRAGKIIDYRYEGLTLRWGRDQKTGTVMRYTPDVVVEPMHLDKLILIEVKGAKIWDRDLVRFKGCRSEWPQFIFQMWQWKDHQWTKIQ